MIEFYPDGIYHFYNRGVDKREIFLSSWNYLYFTQKLIQYATDLSITNLAYCLMPTHFHILVQQDGEMSAGLLCQRVCNSYAKAFNNWVHRTGALLESRYKAIAVENDEYLMHICRYIHANPVKAGLVEAPEKWLYSDYESWMSGTFSWDMQNKAKGMFTSADDYRAFVQDYLHGTVSLPDGFARYTLE
jgi:putative transposase